MKDVQAVQVSHGQCYLIGSCQHCVQRNLWLSHGRASRESFALDGVLHTIYDSAGMSLRQDQLTAQ